MSRRKAPYKTLRIAESDSEDESSAMVMAEDAQRLEQLQTKTMKADLGLDRRELISTENFKKTMSTYNKDAIERTRACNQAGSDAAKVAAENATALAAWNNVDNFADDVGPELEDIDGGQNHRADLINKLRPGAVAHSEGPARTRGSIQPTAGRHRLPRSNFQTMRLSDPALEINNEPERGLPSRRGGHGRRRPQGIRRPSSPRQPNASPSHPPQSHFMYSAQQRPAPRRSQASSFDPELLASNDTDFMQTNAFPSAQVNDNRSSTNDVAAQQPNGHVNQLTNDHQHHSFTLASPDDFLEHSNLVLPASDPERTRVVVPDIIAEVPQPSDITEPQDLPDVTPPTNNDQLPRPLGLRDALHEPLIALASSSLPNEAAKNKSNSFRSVAGKKNDTESRETTPSLTDDSSPDEKLLKVPCLIPTKAPKGGLADSKWAPGQVTQMFTSPTKQNDICAPSLSLSKSRWAPKPTTTETRHSTQQNGVAVSGKEANVTAGAGALKETGSTQQNPIAALKPEPEPLTSIDLFKNIPEGDFTPKVVKKDSRSTDQPLRVTSGAELLALRRQQSPLQASRPNTTTASTTLGRHGLNRVVDFDSVQTIPLPVQGHTSASQVASSFKSPAKPDTNGFGQYRDRSGSSSSGSSESSL